MNMVKMFCFFNAFTIVEDHMYDVLLKALCDQV